MKVLFRPTKSLFQEYIDCELFDKATDIYKFYDKKNELILQVLKNSQYHKIEKFINHITGIGVKEEIYKFLESAKETSTPKTQQISNCIKLSSKSEEKNSIKEESSYKALLENSVLLRKRNKRRGYGNV